jgi:hypothetical protein
MSLVYSIFLWGSGNHVCLLLRQWEFLPLDSTSALGAVLLRLHHIYRAIHGGRYCLYHGSMLEQCSSMQCRHVTTVSCDGLHVRLNRRYQRGYFHRLSWQRRQERKLPVASATTKSKDIIPAN